MRASVTETEREEDNLAKPTFLLSRIHVLWFPQNALFLCLCHVFGHFFSVGLDLPFLCSGPPGPSCEHAGHNLVISASERSVKVAALSEAATTCCVRTPTPASVFCIWTPHDLQEWLCNTFYFLMKRALLLQFFHLILGRVRTFSNFAGGRHERIHLGLVGPGLSKIRRLMKMRPWLSCWGADLPRKM